ncbi:MAG: S8 family serine peptidase [Candidatus Moranbacteria bacterium]|nr:S8 family serine peptidase [Candidatus Moranbacteria bacterium]
MVRQFFAILLSFGLIFSYWPAGVNTIHASQYSKAASKNYVESEVIAEIQLDAEIEKIIEGKNLSFLPIENGNGQKLFLLKSLNGRSTKKIIKSLQKNPDILSLQPNFKYKTLARVANDTHRLKQWFLFDTTETSGGVNAFSAWDIENKNQRNVAIAVIDTGVNTKYKDLKNNLTGGSAKGKNFEFPKKKLSDGEGHGTFLAGIIAAQTNNKKGIAGGSFFNHLRVMALRFDFTTSQAVTAINYAKQKNVPIVNASWGSYGDEGLDLALKDAIASFPGIFVTASGNEKYDHDGADPEQKMYPCDFELANIICVGASDKNGNLADYSDYGNISVDVVAPGGTDDDPIFGLSNKKNKYTSAEGSSLSTAFVSAEAGLIISKYPNLSAAQAIEIIKNSVDTQPSLAGKVLSGGKINYKKALDLAGTY